MKFIFLLLFIPMVAFPQYVANRAIFEVSMNYGQGEFEQLNKYIQEEAAKSSNVLYFAQAPDDFEKGRGLGLGLGYGITHHFALVARYQTFVFKNYNRRNLTDLVLTVNSVAYLYDLEANLNFKATGKAASLNLIAYLFNTPILGISVGAGGGALLEAKVVSKRYIKAISTTGGPSQIFEEINTYKQKGMTPYYQAFIGLDISLGVLTSLIAEGGYRQAIAENLEHDTNSTLLQHSTGPTEVDYSGYFGNAVLRFLF